MADASDPPRPELLSDVAQATLRRLLRVWFDFERRVAQVPIMRRLDLGSFTLQDYQKLLLNLRPQVVEGSRWISRSASSFDRDHADVRSTILRHAVDEHRDYEVLESDFVAAGGAIEVIRAQPRNAGSEALHGYLMFCSSQQNPVGMLGAMWIIEGLGEKMANSWAERIEQLTGVGRQATRFLRYHASNDDTHMDKLYGLLDRVCVSEAVAQRIVQTAVITGRLYVMQLEEIDNG